MFSILRVRRVRSPLLFFTGCCALVLLTGCSLPGHKLNAFGAQELIDQQFEDINIVALLSDAKPPLEGAATSKAGTLPPQEATQSTQAPASPQQIADAFNKFHAYGTPKLRNAIQERILAASEQRCGRYKVFLKQYEGESNFVMGALTTALAGAGALASPVIAARALAGAAGVTSGVNAEFNDKLFAKLTIQVLTKAIDARRKNFYEQILKNRTKKDSTESADLEAYPVEAAIKDALTYHASCSLIAGLEEAGISIDRANNVGLDQLDALQKKYPSLNLTDIISKKPAADKPAADKPAGGKPAPTGG